MSVARNAMRLPLSSAIRLLPRSFRRGLPRNRTALPFGQAPVAQWKSSGLLIRGSEVRILPGAHTESPAHAGLSVAPRDAERVAVTTQVTTNWPAGPRQALPFVRSAP